MTVETSNRDFLLHHNVCRANFGCFKESISFPLSAGLLHPCLQAAVAVSREAYHHVGSGPLILSAHYFLIRWFVSLGNRSQPQPQLFMKILDSSVLLFVLGRKGLWIKHGGVEGRQSGATGRLSAFGVGALIRMNCLRSNLLQNPDTGMCWHLLWATRRQEGFASHPTFPDSLF